MQRHITMITYIKSIKLFTIWSCWFCPEIYRIKNHTPIYIIGTLYSTYAYVKRNWFSFIHNVTVINKVLDGHNKGITVFKLGKQNIYTWILNHFLVHLSWNCPCLCVYIIRDIICVGYICADIGKQKHWCCHFESLYIYILR